MRVTKNYTADGGNRTVIGGVLEIAGGKVIKDGQEVSFGGNQSEPGPGSVIHEMLADKSVRKQEYRHRQCNGRTLKFICFRSSQGYRR
nr:hypothetical protein [Bacillus velezensis]